MGRIRAGLKFNVGKHGRIYVPLGGGSKKRRSGSKAKPETRSTAAVAAPEVTAEPSVAVAIVTGLMSLLLLVGLFFAIVAVSAFVRHESAGDIFGGIVCTVLALAGLYFGALGLVSFISCVKGLKKKKAGKDEAKETARLAEVGMEKSQRYSFNLLPEEDEEIQAQLRRWKLWGGTRSVTLHSNDETGEVSFDLDGRCAGRPDEEARAWITENFEKIQTVSAVVRGGGHGLQNQPRPFALRITLELTEPTVHPARGADPLPVVRDAFGFDGDRVCVLSGTGKIHTCPPGCGVGDAGLKRYLLDDLDEEKYSLCLKCYKDYF